MTTPKSLPTTEVTDELVLSIPDLRQALKVSVVTSGIALKVIAGQLLMDPSVLSRCLNPTEDPRHFPPELIDPLQDFLGNEIPLQHQLLRRGLPSPREIRALLREVEQLRQEIQELRGDRKLVMNIFKGMNEVLP